MQAEREKGYSPRAVEHNLNLKTRESATDISETPNPHSAERIK